MGQISDRYSRRILAVPIQSAKLRVGSGQLLLRGLQDATKEQLYDRTTMKTTGKMGKSIALAPTQTGVVVGFSSSIAPYAAIRLAKRGDAKGDGHKLDLTPARFIRRKSELKIRLMALEANRRIIGA